MKKVLGIIVIVLVIFGGYYVNVIMQPGQVYKNADLGFRFVYEGGYILPQEDNANAVHIAFMEGRQPIVVEKRVGQADDSNAKWGTYILSYENDGWIVTQTDERDGGLRTISIEPMAYTKSGLPIFAGGTLGHGWGGYEYIVALSHDEFVMVSGPDRYDPNIPEYDPLNDPTLKVAESVRVY